MSEVADINPKVGARPSGDREVAFVPMALLDAINGEAIQSETRPFSEVSQGYTIFQDQDVLVAKITPCFENNKIGQARLECAVGVGSTEFHVVRAKPGLAEARYLLHFLRQNRVRADGEKRMTGSGGQRRVPAAFLQNLALPLPPISEQRRIADRLDQADLLRAKRRQALARLDDITQSIFHERFEGLADARVSLGSVCLRITDGTHQPPKWAAQGHPFLFVSNIVHGEIDFQTSRFISDETHAQLTERCPIESGDVLYSTVGTYGVPVVVRTDTKFAFQRHIAHLKPNRELIHPDFLAVQLASPDLKRQADSAARGAAQKTVNLKDIRDFSVVVPAMQEQVRLVSELESIRSIGRRMRAAQAVEEELGVALRHAAFSSSG